MPMYMVIWFSCECKFVFEELSTVNAEKESNCGLFMLGCFVTMIYCILHMLLASLKPKIMKNTLRSKIPLLDANQEIKGYQLSLPDRYRVSIWYLLFSLSNIMLMLLMMTMNGWVELFIALGLGIGYFFFQSAEGQEIEANSCHID